MQSTILAIESSCDDTSAAVIRNGKILNNIIATQSIHENYGGVVPELASRAHQSNIVPVVNQALQEANIRKTQLNAVAFTRGPGLLGSLLVGVSFAKAMALALDIPLIDVNHLQAHVIAHFIDDPKPVFPFLCLTVSGGHTQIVVVEDHLKMAIIGQSQDDAVGEAFDKSAKLLGLPYPGGPLIDQYAQNGDHRAFSFPDTEMPGLDFSFSGIKTAFLYFLRDQQKKDTNFISKNLQDICASLQGKLVQMLMTKLVLATKQTGIRQVAIAGGVAANTGLRAELQRLAVIHGWHTFLPKLEYCTDNAAMIAMVAHYKYQSKDFCDLQVSPMPRMKF